MARTRLDQLLVARGLVRARDRARALILAGDVLVDSRPVTKAGTLVDDHADITLRQPDHPWASRAGLKLAHAVEVFRMPVAGRTALDIGASTGGFTDVLLQAGARRVVSLDVGRSQLDWRLRSDDRVVVLEGVNARYLRPGDLPAELLPFGIVTVDVSFISLRHIFPVIPPLLAPNGWVVALVKPQFEAGRGEVGKGGIIRDAAVHDRVIAEATDAARQVGLERVAVEPAPVTGAAGNQEFLLLLRPRQDST
jgi:23S rRNA (cytidine1920-2'-O)/16S rRNA (cytidine1409-2'-O)-methyltransferase